MANPNWKKGSVSPNPEGRRKMKNSARTVKGMVERFIKRNITPNKLQALYDGLPAKDKLTFLIEILPYCAPKQSALAVEGRFAELSDNDLDKLYNKVVGSFVVAEVIEPEKTNGETLLLNSATFNRYGQE
ncbi:MAG: hypothetical protein JNK14_09100 [Chitinophagaceae bacterium]|nr:hypothetical protein [Chitinophagaceae bacterium]